MSGLKFRSFRFHQKYTVVGPNTDGPNTDGGPNTDAFWANFLVDQILTGAQIKRYLRDTSHNISQIVKTIFPANCSWDKLKKNNFWSALAMCVLSVTPIKRECITDRVKSVIHAGLESCKLILYAQKTPKNNKSRNFTHKFAKNTKWT